MYSENAQRVPSLNKKSCQIAQFSASVVRFFAACGYLFGHFICMDKHNYRNNRTGIIMYLLLYNYYILLINLIIIYLITINQ